VRTLLRDGDLEQRGLRDERRRAALPADGGRQASRRSAARLRWAAAPAGPHWRARSRASSTSSCPTRAGAATRARRRTATGTTTSPTQRRKPGRTTNMANNYNNL
jgi:hypothetical protein